MGDQKIVLISGAGRGLGKGLTERYLMQPGTTVIAGVRDIEGHSATLLKFSQLAKGSKLIIIKLNSVSCEDARIAVRDLQEKYEVHHIDVVIANAGICEHLQFVVDIDINELARHVDVNTFGVLRLFQAMWPLLQRSAAPKLVCISSRLGSVSLSATDKGATGTYGLSKAAANYLLSKIAAEYDNLVAFSVDPGLVQTDMGNRGAAFAGLAEAPVTVRDSAAGIVDEITNATRNKCVGQFRTFDGETISW